jgi:hypothetical protein
MRSNRETAPSQSRRVRIARTYSSPAGPLPRWLWVAAILFCTGCLVAGCGGSGGGQSSEQASATTNEVVECVTHATEGASHRIPDERFREVAERRSLEDLRPAPNGYRTFAQSEATEPALLELYVFASSAEAQAALAGVPEDELPRTSTDIEPNSVGRRGNVVFRFVAGGGPVERVTDQDAIRCLGRLPEPKGAELPTEIADEGASLVAQGYTAKRAMAMPPAQLEADAAPPVVSMLFERGGGDELVLAYFANPADWRASWRAMDRTNRQAGAINSYAACGEHRIYLSLTGGDIRPSYIARAEDGLTGCRIEEPHAE